jgi:hypothetical protein
LRVAAFALAALLPFGMDTRRQQRGMLVYLLGLSLYAGSYGAQILFPEAAWSQSASHVVVVATAFLAFHVAHVAIIFVRSR